MTMDGQEVFKFAVKKVPETIKELLDENGLEPKDVKHYVLHQANYRIAEAIAKRLKVSMEQIPTNMEHYGNTSGASIPLLLDELNRAGKIPERRSAGTCRIRRRTDLGRDACEMVSKLFF